MWTHLDVQLHHFVRRQTFLGWEIRPRRIVDYELVYIVHGQGRILIEEKMIQVGAGNLICFRPGIKHGLSVDHEPCMLFFGVHFGLPDHMDNLLLPDTAKMPSHRMEPLFKSLEEAVRQHGAYSTWRQNLLVEQIICEALIAIQADSEPIDTVRIGRVLDYIHDNPCRPLTMDEMLSMVNLRKTAFLQSFRKITGTTPLQYIQRLRLEYACALLTETDLAVAEVAERCGFSDPFYFSRCFRKMYGTSPRAWRLETLSAIHDGLLTYPKTW